MLIGLEYLSASVLHEFSIAHQRGSSNTGQFEKSTVFFSLSNQISQQSFVKGQCEGRSNTLRFSVDSTARSFGILDTPPHFSSCHFYLVALLPFVVRLCSVHEHTCDRLVFRRVTNITLRSSGVIHSR